MRLGTADIEAAREAGRGLVRHTPVLSAASLSAIVDAGVLSAVAHWAETNGGRRLRLFTRVNDRPGGLAGLLQAVADAGANVLDVEHVRDGVALHVRETGVELTLETRGREHAETICGVLAASGYEIVPELPSRSVVSRA